MVMKVPVRPTPAEQPTRMGAGLDGVEDSEVLRESIDLVKLTRWVTSEGMPICQRRVVERRRSWRESALGGRV